MGKNNIERATFMEEEASWFDAHEPELEKLYPGKWVAISGSRLLAVGDSPKEVGAKADAEGISEFLLTALKAKEYQGKVMIRRAP